MGFEQLEAILQRQRDQIAEGDIYTAPADGSRPINCPLCYSVMRYAGDAGECPMGHWRWPDDAEV